MTARRFTRKPLTATLLVWLAALALLASLGCSQNRTPGAGNGDEAGAAPQTGVGVVGLIDINKNIVGVLWSRGSNAGAWRYQLAVPSGSSLAIPFDWSAYSLAHITDASGKCAEADKCDEADFYDLAARIFEFHGDVQAVGCQAVNVDANTANLTKIAHVYAAVEFSHVDVQPDHLNAIGWDLSIGTTTADRVKDANGDVIAALSTQYEDKSTVQRVYRELLVWDRGTHEDPRGALDPMEICPADQASNQIDTPADMHANGCAQLTSNGNCRYSAMTGYVYRCTGGGSTTIDCATPDGQWP